MAEYTNTHATPESCLRRGNYVLGTVRGVQMIGVTFGADGWRPARRAYAADFRYFGVKAAAFASPVNNSNEKEKA